MSEETRRELDELKLRMNVKREMNNMLDCLLNRAEKKCKQCTKVNTCSVLMEAVFACRNQMKKHIVHN